MSRKIVILSGNYFGQVSGGAEYQLFLLASHLKKVGHRVYYVFIDNKEPIKYDREFHLIPMRKRSLLRKILGRPFFLDVFKLSRWLKRISPEVIIVRGGSAYVGIAARYRVRKGGKLIWQIAHQEDIEPFRPKLKRSIFFDYVDKKFLEYGISSADYVLGQAGYQSDLLDKHYHRPCDLIIPNFHPEPVEMMEKKEPIKIVWISNFKPFKRPELFVDLAFRFKERNGLRFIMIGRNSHVGSLKKFDGLIKRAENIDYKEELSIDEVNRILSGSHILVNTSRFEGFPNTFIQAWMREVPVVSLSVDPDDIIKNLRLGFHSGSFPQMVKDVRMLIDDAKLREEMGKRAREFALKTYSLRNIDRVVKIIEA